MQPVSFIMLPEHITLIPQGEKHLQVLFLSTDIDVNIGH